MMDWRVLGRRVPRREDFRFLTGSGRYLDDIEIPRALHVTFVRSPLAHARIRSIDVTDASTSEGVVVVWTGPDIAARATTLRMAPPIEGLSPVDLPPFPVDKARFVGDLVACVVAETLPAAKDAAERVAVDYEELPAIVDIVAAKATGLPIVDPGLDSNRVSHQVFSAGNVSGAMAKADRIVEAQFRQHRQTHLPLETRGCIAVWDEGRQHLTFHVGTQAPHPYRSVLAARLRLRESQVTVVVPDVGGGFGQKIPLLREELTCAALTIALRRPVRWSEERTENLLASLHAREETFATRTAVTRDGRILALEARIEADFGAYCFFPANYMARVVAMILPGPYRIPAYAYDVRVYLTNKCPAGPMRAPMAAASWVIEGTIDAIARDLVLDPVDVRRTNSIENSDLPFVTVTGETYVDVSPRETLDAAIDAVGYRAFRVRQQAARSTGQLLGLGICTVMESTTYGSEFYKKAGIPGSGHEVATVRVEPSGAILVSCGLMTSGQGYETTLAQCAAEGLGAALEDVAVQIGHTDIAPYGMGSRGSRGATAGGGVVYLAAKRLREKMLLIASSLLGLNTSAGLDLRDGRVFQIVGGTWRQSPITIADISRCAHFDPLRLPSGMEPGLHLTMAFDPPAMTYSNATHICEVAVDTATGRLQIERYIVAHDCGQPINPAVVEGQIHGAVAMGLSGALLENCYYDASGQNLSATLMDYAVATAGDVPKIEVVHCDKPNRQTPAGMKGMSEGGVMGAIGAVSNAVNDALAPLGVHVDAQPLAAGRIVNAGVKMHRLAGVKVHHV